MKGRGRGTVGRGEKGDRGRRIALLVLLDRRCFWGMGRRVRRERRERGGEEECDGLGVDSEELSLIVERFEQLMEGCRSRFVGHGLEFCDHRIEDCGVGFRLFAIGRRRAGTRRFFF